MPCLTRAFVAAAATLASGVPAFARRDNSADIESAKKACALLDESLPGLVAFPGSAQYDADIFHSDISSQENSTCSVEPATADDVSTIIRIIGDPDVRSPRTVKAGGHAYNLNFSSTPGVQISMAKFDTVSYDEGLGTVTLGTGLTWDQVYEALDPLGVNVVGGRINGVGVGGLSLGGGYSWKTNLTVDTIVSFELVLPTGGQLLVTNSSNPDLFFGLKGGLNNYGIVTNIVFEAVPQTQVFGGSVSYSADVIDQFTQAIHDFAANNTDPRAQVVATYTSVGDEMTLSTLIFYDGPTPPPGVLDEILAVPNTTANVSTRSFSDFMTTMGNGDTFPGPEGMAQHTIPMLNYPIPVLNEMASQVNAIGSQLQAENDDLLVSLNMSPEPFISAFAHSKGGAYPHPPDRPVTPSSMSIVYQTPNRTVPLEEQIARQAKFVAVLKDFASKIQDKAVEEGVSSYDDILYPNYALFDTPLALLYGENLPRLREIAAEYDPENVMGLTGGFRFQSQ